MKFENVIIFGCGAAGANTLLNLISDLPDVNYTIVDYDKVEERNYRVGTQPYLKSHLGKHKTQALQMICRANANKKVDIVNKKIEDLPIVILGKTFKKETNLELGSHQSYLRIFLTKV